MVFRIFRFLWRQIWRSGLACTTGVLGGHISIHSHNLYTQSQGVLLTPASDRGSQRSCSSAVLWVSFTFFFVLFFFFSKFHVIEGQNARDQISSDRWYKHAHDQIYFYAFHKLSIYSQWKSKRVNSGYISAKRA